MAKGKGTKADQHFVHSKAQQAYIFGVLAHKDPKALVWGRKWSHRVGEIGMKSPSSKAAYKALPERTGIRKKA